MKPGRMSKDHFGGALMALIGACTAYASLGYNVGSPARMGPGFLPCAVGVLLAITGVLIVACARRPTQSGENDSKPAGHAKHGLPDTRGALCILLGVVSFIAFGSYLGLLPATFSIVLICALGDRNNTLREAVLLALGMCVVAAVVFHWALQIQLPMFQWGF